LTTWVTKYLGKGSLKATQRLSIKICSKGIKLKTSVPQHVPQNTTTASSDIFFTSLGVYFRERKLGSLNQQIEAFFKNRVRIGKIVEE